MMVYVGLGGLAGVALFGILYIIFFLKGISLKLPLIGMILCVAAVAAAAVLLNLFPKDAEPPDASEEPSQAVEDEDPDTRSGTTQDDMAVAGQVLLDKRGLVITSTGFDGGGAFGAELKLLIENNSDSDVIIQVRNPSVNGYMADTVCSIEAAAGKKTEDIITFLSSGLQRCGIETVADMEFSFHIIDSHRTSFLDSEPVKVTTSAADTYQYSYDDSGDELHSENGVRVVSRGISQEGDGVVLFMENTTDKAVTVRIDGISVNGAPVDAVFSQGISAGRRAVYSAAPPKALLEQSGIQEIGSMGFSLHVEEQVGQAAVFDAGPFTVRAN